MAEQKEALLFHESPSSLILQFQIEQVLYIQMLKNKQP